MNKVLVPLLVLVLAGLAYLFVFANDEPEKPDPGSGGAPEISTPDLGSGTEGTPAEVRERQPDVAGPEQPEPLRRQSDPVREQQSYPQGVRGRVMTSGGAPAQGAEIYLVRTLPATDQLQALVRAAQTRTTARAEIGAQGKTGDNGAFELSAPPSEGERSYELHVVAPGHEILKRPVRLVPDQWEDLQILRLEQARKLVGVVRDAKTKKPIEGATVQVNLPSMPMLQATPGFEDGAYGMTDAQGRYEVDHLQAGTFAVKAFGRGYGSSSRDDLTFGPSDRQLTLDFELGEGFVIEGTVTDGQGKALPRARVEARPFSRENPTPSNTYADEQGRFALLGLADGSYHLVASASGYQQGDKKPVRAGSSDVIVVCEMLGQVRVFVSSKQGRPLSAYRLELRRYFEGQETYGRTEVPAQEVRAGRDGSHLFTGVPPGSYVFAVTAIGYAMTYSPSFVVTAGANTAPEVRVTMNEGGTIIGKVTDSSGNPISGVSIKTLENTYQDNPFFGIFESFIPQMVTHTTVSTDEQGQFTLKKLTPSTYQIRADHPSYTRIYKKDIAVEEGARNDIGVIRMTQGGTVSGKVFFQGQPVLGAEVTLNSAPGGEGQPVFEKAFTGPDGTFKISRPLPAGNYEVSAARTDDPNPFMKMKDLQTSKKELRVFDGRDNPVQIFIKP